MGVVNAMGLTFFLLHPRPRWAVVSLRRKCFVLWMEAQEDTAQDTGAQLIINRSRTKRQNGINPGKEEFKLEHKKKK